MRGRYLLALLLVAAGPAAARQDAAGDPPAVSSSHLSGPAALAEMARKIGLDGLIRAGFVQERHARVFAAPLRSAGRMVVAPGHGLLWQVEDPFPVTIALTPTQVIEREEGMPPRITPVAAHPVFQILTGLFLDLPSGRTDAIGTNFDATLEQIGQRWKLGLIPTNPLLSKALSRIDVEGGRFIEHVVVWEQSGDRTEVTFQDFAGQDSAGDDGNGLSPEEARAFRD